MISDDDPLFWVLQGRSFTSQAQREEVENPYPSDHHDDHQDQLGPSLQGGGDTVAEPHGSQGRYGFEEKGQERKLLFLEPKEKGEREQNDHDGEEKNRLGPLGGVGINVSSEELNRVPSQKPSLHGEQEKGEGGGLDSTSRRPWRGSDEHEKDQE